MRLSKRKLQRIIREEVKKTLSEDRLRDKNASSFEGPHLVLKTREHVTRDNMDKYPEAEEVYSALDQLGEFDYHETYSEHHVFLPRGVTRKDVENALSRLERMYAGSFYMFDRM